MGLPVEPWCLIVQLQISVVFSFVCGDDLITIKNETSGNFLCETALLLGHAQVRCIRLGQINLPRTEITDIVS